MEIDDDMFVVIVGDNDDVNKINASDFEHVKIKEEYLGDTSDLDVEDLIEAAERHGEVVNVDVETAIKIEPNTEDSGDDWYADEEYIEDILLEDEEDIIIEKPKKKAKKNTKKKTKKKAKKSTYIRVDVKGNEHRTKMLDPCERKSFVQELIQKYPELKHNKTLLAETLAEIMSEVKQPKLPKNFCKPDEDGTFECGECGHQMDSMTAAKRHYQEQHGERYLMCYACGVDFRSTTNLYKHEKRCNAPDAVVALRARAMFIGSKARNRPFICHTPALLKAKCHPPKAPAPKPARTGPPLNCDLCSATFNGELALQSHKNMHLGIRPFQCKLCDVAYTSSHGLTRHMMKHRGYRFECDTCQRTFSSKACLKAHMDTHNPVKKYPCDQCHKGFSQKMALSLHVMRKHLGLPPPCPCQICPRRFRRMSELKKHMKDEHGLELMTRNMFLKVLPTLSKEELIEKAKIVLNTDAYDQGDPQPSELLKQTIKKEKKVKPDKQIKIHINIEQEIVPDKGNVDEQILPDNDTEVSEEVMTYIKNLPKSKGDAIQIIYIQNGEVVQLSQEDLVQEQQTIIQHDVEMTLPKNIVAIRKTNIEPECYEMETLETGTIETEIVESETIETETVEEETVETETVETKLAELFAEDTNDGSEYIVGDNVIAVVEKEAKKKVKRQPTKVNILKSRINLRPRRGKKGISMPRI